MADDQTGEVARELRRIRFVLTGILFLLALHLCQVAVHHWQESHYQSPRTSQQLREVRGELRAVPNESSNQRNLPPPVIAGPELAARAGNHGE